MFNFCIVSQKFINLYRLALIQMPPCSAPDGVPSPSLLSPTPTSVLVIWNPPLHPNGILLQYAIQRRLFNQTDVILVTTVLPSTLQYIDMSSAIIPNTEYEYQIGAYTSAGVGYGPWTAVTTKPSSTHILCLLFLCVVVTCKKFIEPLQLNYFQC